MPVLPSHQAFHVLLAWSSAVEGRRGWVKLTPAEVPGLAGLEAGEVERSVSELHQLGYCTPAASGELFYLSRQGAKLARVARDMVADGVALSDLTLEALAPRLAGLPFFRLPETLALRNGISAPAG